VENKTEIVQHVLKCTKFPCCLNTYSDFVRVFFNVFTHANIGHLKANIILINWIVQSV
jgi:hypothetical protein